MDFIFRGMRCFSRYIGYVLGWDKYQVAQFFAPDSRYCKVSVKNLVSVKMSVNEENRTYVRCK